ncbi:hypothetical protein D3C85_1392640 [compost metagenome]
MPRGRQAVEGRLGHGEETAHLPLPREQVADEVADMAHLDLARRHAHGVETAVQGLGETVADLQPFTSPVAFEVGLPAAQDIDHRIFSLFQATTTPGPGGSA